MDQSRHVRVSFLQGWSQMIPVRSVLRMPWCSTANRWLAAALHRRMGCGSAGEESYMRVSVVCMFTPIPVTCSILNALTRGGIWDQCSHVFKESNLLDLFSHILSLFYVQESAVNRCAVRSLIFFLLNPFFFWSKCLPGKRFQLKWSPETTSVCGAYWRNASAWWVLPRRLHKTNYTKH